MLSFFSVSSSDLGEFGFLFPLIILLFLWDLIWKGISLWKAGNNQQLVWFISLFIFNTLGILPILYLLYFQKKK